MCPSRIKKYSNCKSLFSSVYVIGTTCFDNFYSMWQLEGNVFHKSLSLPWSFFQPQCSCVVWNKWFEISRYFNFYLHYAKSKVKIQCKYQSFKMKLWYTTLCLRNGVLYMLAWVACLRRWHASVGGMCGVLPW